MAGKRKNTTPASTDGRRGRRSKAVPLAIEAPPPRVSSAMVAYEEVMMLRDSSVPKKLLRCENCHGYLTPTSYRCSGLHKHIVCSRSNCGGEGGGQCPLCAFRQSSVLGTADDLTGRLKYINAGCRYSKYGCASPIAYFDLTEHEAACAFPPCECRECGFEGSPGDLRVHFTESGQHAFPETKIKYGKQSAQVAFHLQDQTPVYHLLVVEAEDGCVFFLSVVRDLAKDGKPFAVNVLCVRNNADAGPEYISTVTATGPLCEKLSKDNIMIKSCRAPLDDPKPMAPSVQVPSFFLQGDEIHLQICISKKARTIPKPNRCRTRSISKMVA